MIGTADLKVERGNGIVGSGNVGVEVGLGNIFGENLSLLFQQSAWNSCRDCIGRIERPTVGGENGR